MKTKQLDITREEANEVLGGLVKQFLRNVHYHLSHVDQEENKEKFTYRTMEIAKMFLFYMDTIAEFLHLQNYVVDLGDSDIIRIELGSKKPTVERVQEILNLFEV
mgnify:FL=1